MIAELCAVVRLELARAASPRNLAVACLCAALALGQGYLTLGAHAALTGSLGEGGHRPGRVPRSCVQPVGNRHLSPSRCRGAHHGHHGTRRHA